jgi:hypothetical protein
MAMAPDLASLVMDASCFRPRKCVAAAGETGWFGVLFGSGKFRRALQFDSKKWPAEVDTSAGQKKQCALGYCQ